MSVDETSNLPRRIQELEKDVDIGKSNVERVVYETKTLYRDVRKVERTVLRVDRFMTMLGMAMPAMTIPGVGAATMLFTFIFQVATLAAEKVTRQEKIEAERVREIERIEFNREMIREIKSEIELESRRREQLRSIAPS